MNYLSPDEIEIRDDLDALLRPLSTDETLYLRESLEKDGWRASDAAKIWGSTLCDGHNRLRIAKELGIERIPVQAMFFENDDECKLWMYREQVGRRNLNDQMRLLYIGQMHSVLKTQLGSLEAARFLAQQENISERSVFRHAETASAFSEADRDVQERFLAGDATSKELVDSLKAAMNPVIDPSLTKEELAERKRASFPHIASGVGKRVMIGIRNLRVLCADVELVCNTYGVDINDYAPETAKYRDYWNEVEAEGKALQRILYENGEYTIEPEKTI